MWPFITAHLSYSSSPPIMLSSARWKQGQQCSSRFVAPIMRASLRRPRPDSESISISPITSTHQPCLIPKALSSTAAPARKPAFSKGEPVWSSIAMTQHLAGSGSCRLSKDIGIQQQLQQHQQPEQGLDVDDPLRVARAIGGDQDGMRASSSTSSSVGYEPPNGTRSCRVAEVKRLRLEGLGSSTAEEMDSKACCSGEFAFKLDAVFMDEAGRGRQPQFGFNGLGELVYQRTYARYLGDGTDEREEWYQTVERVVNGTFSMQKEWMLSRGMPWDEDQAQVTAQEMYRRIFDMKFLPPGRGLWAMGSKLTTERRSYAALNNCAFVSTQDLDKDPTAPFCFLMDASMLGVGVGFDTKGAGKVNVVAPGSAEGLEESDEMHVVVDDSREGWRDALKALLEAYFLGHRSPVFDTSRIRAAGTPIRGFGGVSQGSAPLVELISGIKATLKPLVGTALSVTAIVDIMNKIGVCVVAGNVRRTAEIAFGSPDSEEYIDLKNYQRNPNRAGFGWASNNSVLAKLGMDYSKVCERICQNGEPGFAWLENMRTYGRMADPKNHRDVKAMGGNPCLEQTLESFEMCCLVETFPNKHDSLDDFLETLRFAFMYAKTVTLGGTPWKQTNEILFRNRRIGCSMSGLAQFVASRGVGTLKEWCEMGYKAIATIDQELSERFEIPRSIKTTSVKPSGTVSLLAGATPGMHYPESRFYLRRVRVSADSDVLGPLREAGYRVEPAATDPEGTMVVEVPVDAGEGVRTVRELSMWEQLSFAAFLQRFWADNQVSCTVTFDPETEGHQLPHALDYFQYQLKGVSFLPRVEHGAFPQMPYEAICEEQYKEMTANLRKPDFSRRHRSPARGGAPPVQEVPDQFCETDACISTGTRTTG